MSRRWKPHEDDVLLEMVALGESAHAIGAQLERSPQGVKHRAVFLSLDLPRTFWKSARDTSTTLMPTSGLNLPSVPRKVLALRPGHSSQETWYVNVSVPRVSILESGL